MITNYAVAVQSWDLNPFSTILRGTSVSKNFWVIKLKKSTLF